MFFGGSGFPGGFSFGEGGGGGGGGGGYRGKKADTDKYYKLLEVSKNSSPKDIKQAYRKLAIKHHPDKGGDPEVFKEIGRAYEVLSDPEKKQKYDQYGEEGLEGDAGGDASDIFNMFFGGRGGKRSGGKRKGADIVHPLDMSLEQLYTGTTKKLAVTREILDKSIGVCDCVACEGRGVRVQIVRMGPMVQQLQSACENCQGQGKSYVTKKEREVLEVYVDKGAFDGYKIPFRGKADEKPGFETGDVVFVINEKDHNEFKRKGCDLYIHRKITLLEALTGIDIEVTHLDGRKLLIKTSPGEIICPQKEVEEHWESFDDTDVIGEVYARAQTTDIEQLKQAAAQKGLSGFVVDIGEGRTQFWNMDRDSILRNKKKDRSTKGKRLYVCPDPVLLGKLRMMKAVKGEGMPYVKNPMLRGNLFIKLEIIFPEQLTVEAQQSLKSILPQPSTRMISEDDCEIHFVEDVDPEVSAKEFGDHSSAYDDDDDAAHGHGARGVQCAQQ